MSPRAILFDFGGVFVDSPFAAVEAAADDLGVAAEALIDTVFGTYEEDTDHPWHRLERGEVTFESARAEISTAAEQALGVSVDPVELLMRLGGGGVRTVMVEFCRSLRGLGVRTGLLTNNAAEFAPLWRPLLPLDELFDDVVDSSEVGLRKPDARIYELALQRLDVAPAAACFVDDAPGNVAGARAVGIHAVHIGPLPEDEPAAIEAMERWLRSPRSTS